MKKVFILILLSVLPVLALYAQNTIKWSEYRLKYESPEKLKEYQTPSSNVYGRDNSNYAVDVHVVPLTEKTQKFRADIKYAANEIASGMSIKDIQQGDHISGLETGYFIYGQAIDIDNSVYPVIVAAVIDKTKEVAFEIKINCYNKDLQAGISIAKSFEFF